MPITTPPFAELARQSGLFDRVETDGRPEGVAAHLKLFRRLRARAHRRTGRDAITDLRHAL